MTFHDHLTSDEANASFCWRDRLDPMLDRCVKCGLRRQWHETIPAHGECQFVTTTDG